MQNFRQFAGAFLLAFFSVLIVLGGLSLSLAEMEKPSPPEATQTLFSTPIPLTATPTIPPAAESPTATNTSIPTETPQPVPSCPAPPVNWIAIYVLPGDTIYTIASRQNANIEQIRIFNCLVTDSLIQGSTLFVPPAPAYTSVRCGPPFGWVKTFAVHPGDTLFSISQSYGITLASLKLANCRDDRNLIYNGELLWVPNLPTRTPTITATIVPDYVTMNPTLPLTETSLPFTETVHPSNTPIPATNTVQPTLTLPPPTLTASPTALQ